MTEPIRFDRYYRYEAITQFLQNWVEKYPTLCHLESIGKTYEGRDIWLLTLTNRETGSHDEKPAYWVDANIHATEVSGSTAVLYLINRLLTQYGKNDKVTHALDSRTFYAVPRLNYDGAEWALADKPRFIRSSTRPYPRTEQLDGLYQEDVDGDGRLLLMRIPDPNGAWKPHPDEPRLMIPRNPDEPLGGSFYRLLQEGRIQNYDGVTIKMPPPVQGLDINRQFPVFWQPDQAGAGHFPGSEPETHAAMKFVTSHPNITGSTSFHTYSGVHLRAPTSSSDDTLPTEDLRTFKLIGNKGEDLTGYPAVSIHHDFKYDPKSYIRGTFSDWMYEHQGTYAWTTEIWSVQRQAGITDFRYIDWFQNHPIEHDLKIIKWFDETLDGEGLVEWYEFDHPELGKVELGGWDSMNSWRNPPLPLLEKEIAPLSDFVLYCALISPKLELHSVNVESNGDLHKIRLVVQNTGWLPTNVTQRAVQMKTTRQLEVDIRLPDGATLISGEPKTMCGQLTGWNMKRQHTLWTNDASTERAKVEWVVQAEQGTVVELTAVHSRAGTVHTTVTLQR